MNSQNAILLNCRDPKLYNQVYEGALERMMKKEEEKQKLNIIKEEEEEEPLRKSEPGSPSA